MGDAIHQLLEGTAEMVQKQQWALSSFSKRYRLYKKLLPVSISFRHYIDVTAS